MNIGKVAIIAAMLVGMLTVGCDAFSDTCGVDDALEGFQTPEPCP